MTEDIAQELRTYFDPNATNVTRQLLNRAADEIVRLREQVAYNDVTRGKEIERLRTALEQSAKLAELAAKEIANALRGG
jgi:hypothetical protein